MLTGVRKLDLITYKAAWKGGGFLLGFQLVAFFFVVIFLIYGIYKRSRLWNIGRKEELPGSKGDRWGSFFKYAIFQGRVLRESFGGLMHIFIYIGFTIPLLFIILSQFELRFPHPLAFALSIISDVAGALGIVGIIMAWYRRGAGLKESLETKKSDYLILLLVLLIFVTGFLTEGTRLKLTEIGYGSSPVGAFFSFLVPSSISFAYSIRIIHMFFVFLFIMLLPFSKLRHLVISSLNIYWRNLGPKNEIKPLDIENEEAESFGVARVNELTWKDLLDSDACVECGRCQDNCPAYQTGKPLSPKQIIKMIRENMEEAWENGIDNARVLNGELITFDEIWSCTTCGACTENCPVFVEHPTKIVGMRQYLTLMESKFPEEAQVVFRNMENNSNPWGVGSALRTEWAKDLNVKLASEGDFEILYWVGCAGAYDDRYKKVAAAVVELLNIAGVNFAILGVEEGCCGDSARRLGNEYLYQMMAKMNIETLNNYNVKKILVTCPHGYNIIKNEYPQFGGKYEVYHHTEFLLKLVEEGRLKIKSPIAKKSIIHDACYLGRYNDIYDQPRKLLSMVTGDNVLEFDRRREKSFCCGAGGGRMWLEEKIGKRINEERVEEGLKKNPELFITTCPFCLTMMIDGIKAKVPEESPIDALDIAEILLMAVKGEA